MITNEPEDRTRVVVVDDDATVSDVVCRYLQDAGFAVDVVSDGAAALEHLLNAPPDLVILDLMLPGLDGLEVFRRLRAAVAVPVIMLTALGEETDRLAGLELGADDYITKPFSPRELVLRAQSVLRRGTGSSSPPPPPPASLSDGTLQVDGAAHQVRRSGIPVALTGREYDLLVFLMQHPQQAFSREQLLQRVWGWQYADHSTVTVHVRRLREKIEDDPHQPARIVTVFGVGYRYEPEEAGQ